MSVAAVIPAYNAEGFIRLAIDSVLGQTERVDEIIVVDDGSKDGTCGVVESYGDRVRLLRQQNRGPSVARNRGAREARSKYVAFLDADDRWHREKTARQVRALEAAPAAVLCYTGLLNFNPQEDWEAVTPAIPLGRLRKELRLRNPSVIPSSVMVPREAFLRAGGFDETLKGVEDWDFVIAMLEQGPFCNVDEPLTLYRCSTTGMSANAELVFRDAERLLERRLLGGMSAPQRWLWRRRFLSFQAYTASLNARAAKRHASERQWILYSLGVWPSPLWKPVRFKAFAVTMKNRLLARG